MALQRISWGVVRPAVDGVHVQAGVRLLPPSHCHCAYQSSHCHDV